MLIKNKYRTKFFLYLLAILFPFLQAMAQQDTVAVLMAVQQLEAGLIKKDSAAVNRLLNAKVVYGHSNGWLQSKSDILRDMKSGYLVYRKIEQLSVAVTMNKRKEAIVKERIAVEGQVNGNEFAMNLFVLHLWRKIKGKWQLLMRQSTKV